MIHYGNKRDIIVLYLFIRRYANSPLALHRKKTKSYI